jgi:hypothetical protein
MGRDILELASYMQPLCRRFLVDAIAAGIPVTLVDTGRTSAEQVQKLAQGVSWTRHSRHEPQPPEMKSEAFDVVPTAYIMLKGWNPGGPAWKALGAIGEKLGLKWGGRFPINQPYGDPGHFEWIKPQAEVAQSGKIPDDQRRG